MDKLKKQLGVRIRTLREERHITQEELAERVGFHPTYVAKLEAGERAPSFESLFRFANALGVKPADLMMNLEAGYIKDEPADPGLVEEIVELMGNSSVNQIALVRDLLILLKRYNVL